MKIKKTNGLYWNADNNCFGPIQAATEYENGAELPMIIEDNNSVELEMGEGYYYNDNDEAIASLEQKK